MSKILIIDDDEILMEMLKDILEESEDVVLMASKPGQAMKLFEDTKPDLVIIDVIMPGLDGFELLRQFKECRHNVKSILLSGLNDDRCREQAEKLGADKYIVKPPDLEMLKLTIRRLLQYADS